LPLYALDSRVPQVDATAFIAPSAELIGQVFVAREASVWFGAVLRGDLEAITVGAGSNVQDGAVLHTDAGHPCVLAQGVTVGHRAIVHGAACGPGSLVGMGAVMLSGSSLGAGAVLGAGALLPEGAHVPDGMLALGVPARVVRPAPRGEHAARYVQNAARYNGHLQVIQSGLLQPSTPDVVEVPVLDG
jgi:carbonic anhydrase/acetyltransferase-like protein (isoleucine patch superfamily)